MPAFITLLSCTTAEPSGEDTGFSFEDARWIDFVGNAAAWCGVTTSGELRCFNAGGCSVPGVDVEGPVEGVSGAAFFHPAYPGGMRASAVHSDHETVVWGRWCVDGADHAEVGRFDVEGISYLPPMPSQSFGEWWLYADGDRWVGPQGGCLRAGTEDGFITDGTGFPPDERHPTEAPVTASVRSNRLGVCTFDSETVRCAGLTPDTREFPPLAPDDDLEPARYAFENYMRHGRAVDVTMGYRFVCIIDETGRAHCETSDDAGTADDIMPPEERFVDLEADWNHVCGLKIDGSVVCWGPHTGLLTATTATGPFTKITPYCGLTEDGRIECWSGELATTECEDVVDTMVD